MCRQSPAGERCVQAVSVWQPLSAFTAVGSLEIPGRLQKSSPKWAFNCRVQSFTAETEATCNRKWTRWGMKRFAELWGVKRPLVCLTFWQPEQLPPWLLSMVLSRLNRKTWTCKASSVDQRPNRWRVDTKVEWEQGEQWARGSALPTTGCPQTTVWEA